MKLSLTRRFLLASSLLAGALVAGRPSAAMAAEAVPNQKLLDLMAEGKAETDLGRYDAAIRALSAIVDAPDAPPALRAEALVRLGAARRAAGDFEGALQAFEQASKAPGLDSETKALLVQVLGGALPGADRWAEIWRRVSFTVDRSEPARPTLAVVWPDVTQANVYSGKPLTLRRWQGDLQELFRLIADVSGLNVVVNPGVHGRAVIHMENQPWDRILDHVLSANGLAYQWEDNVLRIAPPRQLWPPRHFSGRRIDLDWGTNGRNPGRELREGLAELAAVGRATVVIDPAVEGNVVLKLNQVRWDQAFDIVVRVNGLDWTRDGDSLKVFPGRGSAESR
jgi:tetratricopeptide (TPR) repeat protein